MPSHILERHSHFFLSPLILFSVVLLLLFVVILFLEVADHYFLFFCAFSVAVPSILSILLQLC